MDAQAQQQMQQIQQQQQQQSSTKVFTVVETRHLLKILMNPKTLALFKDNKQSHSFVWNYIYKCMKLKFPKFAKSTRQCYKKCVFPIMIFILLDLIAVPSDFVYDINFKFRYIFHIADMKT